MAIKQEVNAPLIWTIGTISGFLFLVIVIGLQAWYLWAEGQEMEVKNQRAQNVFYDTALADQRKALTRTGPIDNGRHAVPIDRAIEEIVRSKGKLPATQPAR